MAEITRVFTIKNKFGLHVRPSVALVDLCSKFESKFYIKKRDGGEVDAEEILEVLILSISCGEALIVRAVGDDAAEALQALEKLVEDQFGVR